MKRFFKHCLSLFFAIVVLACNPQKAAAPSPNVIIVMTDDQGYGDLGIHNQLIKTPVLDKLAKQSVQLTNFHVDPTCSPTRAALMTGKYSINAGVWHTVMGRHMLASKHVLSLIHI